MQTLFVVCFANDKLLLLAGGVFLTALVIFTAFSIERTFLLLAFYVSSFEVRGYLIYFPGFTIWYSWKISYPLFALLILYWLIYLSKSREQFTPNQMDSAVLIFLVAMFLGAINGFFRGYDRMLFFYDFLQIPFFLGYFIFLYSPFKYKIKKYYDFLLIFSVFVSIQFIYAITKFKTFFLLQRIVSEHIHISQFAVPYVIATLIYSKSLNRKRLFAFILPLLILGVILSQQRSLYGSIALSSLVLIGIFLYSRREWIKEKINLFILYISITCVIVIAISTILQVVTKGRFFTTLYTRFFIFLNPQLLSKDTSWIIRWREIGDALQGLEHFWLFGKGFGASFITRCRYMIAIVVDQSYVYLIWKTGIIGLLSLLYMYFVFFKRGILTLRKKITSAERIFVITALLNTAGMMLIAFANVSIAHFRLMFVWAGLFAATEAIARRYD